MSKWWSGSSRAVVSWTGPRCQPSYGRSDELPNPNPPSTNGLWHGDPSLRSRWRRGATAPSPARLCRRGAPVARVRRSAGHLTTLHIRTKPCNRWQQLYLVIGRFMSLLCSCGGQEQQVLTMIPDSFCLLHFVHFFLFKLTSKCITFHMEWMSSDPG